MGYAAPMPEPNVLSHLVALPPGPGPFTGAYEAPPYPDRFTLWATGPIEYRLTIGPRVIAGPYAHDPAVGGAAPLTLTMPASAVLQLRNPAGGGATLTAVVCRSIATTRGVLE